MANPSTPNSNSAPTTTSPALIAVAWLWVGLPLAWGVYQTLLKAAALFH